MKTLFVSLCLILLTGCAAPVSVTSVTAPSGKQAYSMKCSGMGRDRQDCLVKAGELCPRGYTIVDDSSETSGAVVTKGAVVMGHRNYMTISCK